jgi:hypothetical protein
MKTPITLLALVALLAGLSQAQQPQPQPAPTQPQAAPCVTTPTPQPPKGWHLNIPKGLQQAIDKQRQQIQNKTGLTIPSTQDLTNQAKQAVSPCGKAPAPAPAALPIPATTPAPQIPAKAVVPPAAPSEISTSVYGFACPKGTKLHVVPGYAYCEGPKGDVTPAILMMAGFPMPDGYYAQTAAEALANTPEPK